MELTNVLAVNRTPPTFELWGEDGRRLLSIAPDGTVTGDIADAEGAARVFVEHIRQMIGQYPLVPGGQFEGPS